MKDNKATGPDEFLIEVVRKPGETGNTWMTAAMRDIKKNEIPFEWRKSKITPLFNQKETP